MMNQLNITTVGLTSNPTVKMNAQITSDLSDFQKTSTDWDRLSYWMTEITDSLSRPEVLTVTTSMRQLDAFARKVDKLLDEPGADQTRLAFPLSESLLQNVERITLPVQHLADPNYRFSNFQKEMVKQSYINNTAKRESIYSLDLDAQHSQCTLDYLRPLLGLISDDVGRRDNIDKFFLIFAQIVQILDDFVDLSCDVSGGIRTPVSVTYMSKIEEQVFLNSSENSYTETLKAVVCRVSRLSSAAEKISFFLLSSSADSAIRSDLRELKEVMIECQHLLVEVEFPADRLTTLIRQIPPVFCYG